MFGHRGLTHSMLFAAVLSLLVFLALRQSDGTSGTTWALYLYLFISTASHGFIDAFTNGGLGVAFFAPFSNTRYFMPWTPIEVSPISVSRFFSARGLEILESELLWVWLPCLALAALCRFGRKVSAN